MINNIIDVVFISIIIYNILNVSLFLIYKHNIRNIDEGIFLKFLIRDVDENKFTYVLFTMFVLLYNYIKKDYFKLKYYKYKLEYNSYYYRTEEERKQLITEINKSIHQIEMKIKLKNLKKH